MGSVKGRLERGRKRGPLGETMVRLRTADAEHYPFFDRWLREVFVHVTSKSRVMDAFWTWSDFTGKDKRSRRIFTYGWEPEIIPIDIEDQGCDYDVGGTADGFLYGRTSSKEGILVNRRLVDLFESAMPDVFLSDGDVSRADAVLIAEVVESTILHEMIHWTFAE